MVNPLSCLRRMHCIREITQLRGKSSSASHHAEDFQSVAIREADGRPLVAQEGDAVVLDEHALKRQAEAFEQRWQGCPGGHGLPGAVQFDENFAVAAIASNAVRQRLVPVLPHRFQTVPDPQALRDLAWAAVVRDVKLPSACAPAACAASVSQRRPRT